MIYNKKLKRIRKTIVICKMSKEPPIHAQWKVQRGKLKCKHNFNYPNLNKIVHCILQFFFFFLKFVDFTNKGIILWEIWQNKLSFKKWEENETIIKLFHRKTPQQNTMEEHLQISLRKVWPNNFLPRHILVQQNYECKDNFDHARNHWSHFRGLSEVI